MARWSGAAGREVATTPAEVRAFADSLGRHDEVALEATGNAWAIATVLQSRAGRVVVSNPAQDSRDRRAEGEDRPVDRTNEAVFREVRSAPQAAG